MRHGHIVGHNRRVQYQTAGPAVLGGDVTPLSELVLVSGGSISSALTDSDPILLRPSLISMF